MWAYADPSGVPLSITNPLPGTIRIATALVFGALAGVLCERAGVVNIAIEGQFIAGAFFASVFSSFAVAASPPSLSSGARSSASSAASSRAWASRRCWHSSHCATTSTR